MVRGWTFGQKRKTLLSTPPPLPPWGCHPDTNIGFLKKLAVTNGCVGVTVLSKILHRMALSQGPTPYPYILSFSERV